MQPSLKRQKQHLQPKETLISFLEHGDKAKVTCRFRGREMAHQNIGMDLMKRVEQDLLEYGSVEMLPKPEGRQITMVLAPIKKKR